MAYDGSAPSARSTAISAWAPSPDIHLRLFTDPAPSRRLAMFWRETSVYADFLPKVAAIIRDLPAGLVHEVTAGLDDGDTAPQPAAG